MSVNVVMNLYALLVSSQWPMFLSSVAPKVEQRIWDPYDYAYDLRQIFSNTEPDLLFFWRQLE